MRAHVTDHQDWATATSDDALDHDIDEDWHDAALYTGIGRRTGYRYPAFVGSPQTVANALLAYYDLGVRIFGVGPSPDAGEERGLTRELFRLLRGGVATRELAAA